MLIRPLIPRAALAALPAALLLALPAGAQTSGSGTSPAGNAGNDGSDRLLLMDAPQRLQQIDNTLAGTPRTISGIAFRRDSLGGGGMPGPRTLDVRVRLDVVSLGTLNITFDDNLIAPVEVFPRQTVTMPDWAPAAVGFAAPFDLVIDFATPFQYSGTGALLIDVDWNNLSRIDPVWFDADVRPNLIADPVFYGGGCSGDPTAFPPNLTLLVENGGPGMASFGMRLIPRVQGGIPNSPVFMFIDAIDRNLTVPGLCGTFHTDGTLSLFLGVTNAFGLLDYQYLSFPYGVGLEGVDLVTQAIQADFNSTLPIPWALTNPVRNTMPVFLPLDTPESAYHVAATPFDPTSAYGEVIFGGGVVIELR